MSVTAISDGQLVTKDSSEVFLYTFDYDGTLQAGVELATVGTFVITPSMSPGLVASGETLLVGNRKVQVLLTGGIYGLTYTIEHTVSTNETPAQTFSPWFRLRIT